MNSRLEIVVMSLHVSDMAQRQISAQSLPDADGPELREIVDKSDGILVAVVDARQLIRECIARCLESALGKGTVETFSSLAEWHRGSKDPSGTALILLCGGPKAAAGLPTDREFSKAAKSGKLPRMVILSDAEDAGDILTALDGGAQGYIPTSLTLDVAVEALRLVRAGGMFIPASSLMSARRALETSSRYGRLRAAGLFTERQAAVVEALREGKANKVIAHELKMQESTVKVHVRNIMKKLKARNRTEVAYLTKHLFDN